MRFWLQMSCSYRKTRKWYRYSARNGNGPSTS